MVSPPVGEVSRSSRQTISIPLKLSPPTLNSQHLSISASQHPKERVEREPWTRESFCCALRSVQTHCSAGPAVCSCHTAGSAALWLVRRPDAGPWLVHWRRAAHPGGEFGGQLNVKSKVTPAVQAGPATGHSLVENLKMLFFFAKIKFAILPSSSVMWPKYKAAAQWLIRTLICKICYHTYTSAGWQSHSQILLSYFVHF